MNQTALLVSTLASVGILASCNDTTRVEAQPKAIAAAPPSNEMEIKPNESLLKSLKVGEPRSADVGINLSVAARLEVDETRVTRVGSPVMGRITSLSVHEGQEVTRGQVMAQLNSTGLSNAQLDFLKALSQRQLAQRAVERAQLLVKADVIGTAELQRREAEATQASAEVDAARNELAVLGMPIESVAELERTRAINSTSRIISTMDGTILERKIAIGQVIQPADTVFEIADLSSLWLVADVPEQNAGNLHVGQTVDAELAAFPGRTISGQLSFVSATVNPETRTVRARMELPNPNRRFKPAMLATMTLKDQTERQQVVPNSAVVREDNTEHVFVQIKDDTFLLRPVMLGLEQAGSRVLIEGVRPGERIVLDGAFHLNNERRRQALRGSDGE